MTEKLKKRIILAGMILSGAVLLLIVAVNLVNVYNTEIRQIESSLDRTGSFWQERIRETGHRPEGSGPRPGDGNDPGGRSGMRREEIPSVYSFAVFCAPGGEITEVFSAGQEPDSQTVSEAVAAAAETGSEAGTLRRLSLAFRRTDGATGSVYTFADTSGMKDRIVRTASVSAVLAAAGLLLFYFALRFLAGRAVKPVEDAWESQKQFVADVSHDLKTPLTVILANSRILRSHGDDTVSSQKKWIDGTEEEAIRMEKLIESMLELARSESGSDAPVLSDVSASDICSGCVLELEPVAFDRGVTVESDIPDGIVCRADPESLERVVTILVENAVKYSPEGDTVRLSLSKTQKNVKITVENHGEPIKKEDLPHVFERFYRSDRSRSTPGFGLGLAIAKNLTGRMGGRISAESGPGGTVFSVILQ